MSLIAAVSLGVAGLLASAWIDTAVSRQLGHPPRLAGLALVLLISLLAGVAVHLSDAPPLSAGGVAAALAALGVAMRTDWRFGQVADASSVLIALSAVFGASFIHTAPTALLMASGAITAAGILALASLYMKLRRGFGGLGLGDIGLAAACGLWCDPLIASQAVALGAGLTFMLGLMRNADAKTRLPFAPGLGLGFIIVLGGSSLV